MCRRVRGQAPGLIVFRWWSRWIPNLVMCGCPRDRNMFTTILDRTRSRAGTRNMAGMCLRERTATIMIAIEYASL